MTNHLFPSVQNIILGFAWFVFFFTAITSFFLKRYPLIIQQIIKSACYLVALTGIMFVLDFTINTLFLYFEDPDSLDGFRVKQILESPFYFIYWLQVLHFLPIQLLWIKRIRTNRWWLLSLSLFILFDLETTIAHFTALHRDYLPSTWRMIPSDWIIINALHLGLFCLALVFFHFIRIWLTQHKPNTSL